VLHVVGEVVAGPSKCVAGVAKALSDLVAGVPDIVTDVMAIHFANALLDASFSFAVNALGVIHSEDLQGDGRRCRPAGHTPYWRSSLADIRREPGSLSVA
jgi:hypothetical protein